MSGTLNNAGIFLINTLFDLYLFILAIRLILVWIRADYYNPLSQFVIKLSSPVITPLRRLIPNVANIELSTLLFLILLEMAKFTIIGTMTSGFPNITGVILLAIADSLKVLINIFFYAILLQVILSWVQPNASPVGQILTQVTSPIMRPLHRWIPPIAGFDITPIPALIGLQLLIIILVTPLFGLGLRIAFGQ